MSQQNLFIVIKINFNDIHHKVVRRIPKDAKAVSTWGDMMTLHKIKKQFNNEKK